MANVKTSFRLTDDGASLTFGELVDFFVNLQENNGAPDDAIVEVESDGGEPIEVEVSWG